MTPNAAGWRKSIMPKQKPDVEMCFDHKMARFPDDERWSVNAYVKACDHRFDIVMKKTKCPECLKSREKSTPITFDGTHWAR